MQIFYIKIQLHLENVLLESKFLLLKFFFSLPKTHSGSFLNHCEIQKTGRSEIMRIFSHQSFTHNKLHIHLNPCSTSGKMPGKGGAYKDQTTLTFGINEDANCPSSPIALIIKSCLKNFKFYFLN